VYRNGHVPIWSYPLCTSVVTVPDFPFSVGFGLVFWGKVQFQLQLQFSMCVLVMTHRVPQQLCMAAIAKYGGTCLWPTSCVNSISR